MGVGGGGERCVMVTRASGVDIDQRAQSKNPVERLEPVFDKIRKHYRR